MKVTQTSSFNCPKNENLKKFTTKRQKNKGYFSDDSKNTNQNTHIIWKKRDRL